ncbi:hypothetical protein DFH08DRAFT_698175 [Mycena albidolilacea]|uniref:Uncharacterized protein n=1 Tax=Mycena albidolilacea TaxID=1033008 RepID=A0AAD7ETK4_9AGAR|nr:hypothetical protein DFH08DRAFT_698175 [Mycena albidolilacea]
MLSSVLVIVPFLAGINALNDWTVPCTSGECSYDLPAANNSATGSLKIWGSSNAITDITKAADWQIIGCDPNALQQDIRLVCMNDPDDPNSKCGHLYESIGAVNKVVRLPEDCGANAFARISKAWVPDDQSIPTSVRRGLVRRSGKVPVVKALSIDTNFEAVDWSKAGPVNIAILANNVPGQANNIQVPKSRRSSRAHRRFSLGGAIDGLKDGIDNAAGSVGDAVKDAAGDPLTFDKTVNLINSDISCGKVSASLQVDMDANANAQVSMTVQATGTIAPPKLTSFGVIAGMTADVAGTMTMTADITGHVDSGKIQLEINLIAILGFDFPGILTVGPSFTVSAQVVGDVDVVMDMTVGLNFNVDNAQLAFPPDDKNKPVSSAFSIGDTPLTLNAAPDVTATGTLTAHLIPSLNLGVSALGNKAKAQIFLNLDTQAALEMNLDGSASKTKVSLPLVKFPKLTISLQTATTDDSTTKSLGGCINVNGGISVNVGAEGSFFGKILLFPFAILFSPATSGLFDKLANAKLFNKNFKIFTVRSLGLLLTLNFLTAGSQKCFGDQATNGVRYDSICYTKPMLYEAHVWF